MVRRSTPPAKTAERWFPVRIRVEAGYFCSRACPIRRI
jgi:hypothetical protein